MTKEPQAKATEEVIKALSVDEQLAVVKEEIQRLTKAAKDRGAITIEEINESLPPEITAASVLDHLMQSMELAGVNITEPSENKKEEEDGETFFLDDSASNAKEEQEEEEEVADTRSNDPVRLYLRKMGSVSLLTREGEVEIARRIEQGEREIVRAILKSPIGISEIIQLGDLDWWRPSGLLVEVGIRGSVKLSFLKGLSGNFTQVVVPQCVHRIRKIPRQDAEKDKDLQLMLQDYKPNLLDRSYNVILTKLYGRPCTEDIGVLINRIKAHEAPTEMENNFYVVEEAYVRSVRRLMFWANTQVGSRSDASGDTKRPSVQTKLRAGFVYGQLRRPEEFAGGTLSYSKTFQLPASTRERIRNWITAKFPGKFLNLMNYSWGWNGKVGALIWNERFFPYFLTGPEFGTEISGKGAVHPGTVMDVLELLKNSANSVTSAYDGQSAGNTRQDQVPLEEYAQQQAQRRSQTVLQGQTPAGADQ